MKTLEELKAELAALFKSTDKLSVAITAEQDKEARKVLVTELKEANIKVTEIQADITDLEDEASAMATHKDFSKPNKSKTAGKKGNLPKSTVTNHHDCVYDDPKLGFKHYGDVAHAVYQASLKNGHYDDRLNVIKSGDNPELLAAGLRQSDGPDGGFLVPVGVRSARLENEQGLSLDLYGQTTNFELGQEESIQIPAIDETDRENMYGGIQANWIEEEEAGDESEPQFRQIDLRPQELMVRIKVSNKLLRNSTIALGQFLDMASNDVINNKRSNAIFNGTGAGKPKGILQSGALITVAKEGSQTADTIVVENTLKMVDELSLRWMSGAAFYANKRAKSQLSLFKIGDHPVFLPGGTVAGMAFDTLHGFPVIYTEYNQVLGDKGDIYLANLAAYVTAQHGGGVRADSSEHFYFDTAHEAFRYMTDADGQTWMKEPVVDLIGTGTSSAFITLAERT